MDTHRKIAIIVGVLFILAIVMLFIGQAFYEPILGSPDYLEDTYPNKRTVILGILIEFTGTVFAVALIPVFLFPILKRHSEALALGYFGFRLLEVVLHAIDKLKKLSLISLSQRYLGREEMDASTFQTIGSSIQSESYWAFWLSIVVFAVGALIFYSILYKSRLVPRWISGWGFFAALVLLAGTILPELGMFAGFSGLALELIFVLPIPLNEIALSIWLIAKGFNPSAIAPEPVKAQVI